MRTKVFPLLLIFSASFAAPGAVRSFNSVNPALGIGCHLQPDSSATTNPAEVASVCNALGVLDLRAGDFKAAEAKVREAVSLATQALGEASPDVGLYEANLALALGLQGQLGRADVLLNRARYIVDATLPPGDVRLATVLTVISAVETAEKKFARAEADAAQSLAIVLGRNASDSLEVAVQQEILATVYIREKKIVEAEAMLPGTVVAERRLAASPSFDRRALAQSVRTLGELRALEHNWSEARSLYLEAIGLYEATSGANHPAIVPILLEYADVLRHCDAPKQQVKSVEARARMIKTMRS